MSNLWKTGWICAQRFQSTLTSQDLWSTIRTKSGLVIHNIETNLYKSGFVITETIQIQGFARRLHGYTIPWYNSRNLNLSLLFRYFTHLNIETWKCRQRIEKLSNNLKIIANHHSSIQDAKNAFLMKIRVFFYT